MYDERPGVSDVGERARDVGLVAAALAPKGRAPPKTLGTRFSSAGASSNLTYAQFMTRRDGLKAIWPPLAVSVSVSRRTSLELWLLRLMGAHNLLRSKLHSGRFLDFELGKTGSVLGLSKARAKEIGFHYITRHNLNAVFSQYLVDATLKPVVFKQVPQAMTHQTVNPPDPPDSSSWGGTVPSLELAAERAERGEKASMAEVGNWAVRCLMVSEEVADTRYPRVYGPERGRQSLELRGYRVGKVPTGFGMACITCSS
ncbi:hypothetical protein FA15DRAFT_657190 [Coprinopsis marcescibilis]|uniref:Uncharacterized protein n=1 Tax=Coprinopsis marcescibilis TaxID=230819 RepID=A0A5C3KQW9_COPMA|nr:hypothetical protein FA15DRAFT_657190 [Coprinopsis marcescibilis]